MYRKKDRMGQKEIKFVSLEDLVPEDHLLREIEVNSAYRWFICYDLFEKIPHFSTFGKN